MLSFSNINKKKLLLWVAAITTGIFLLTILSFVLIYRSIGSYDRYIYSLDQIDSQKDIPSTGIVFGAGIEKDGTPSSLLKERLDKAAEAYQKGVVSTLLVSGDNRFLNYNEPQAMKEYLITEKSVPESNIQQDFAGRSTYETCERASKIFQVKRALLFTESTHLPRALYLCRHFSIEAYGIKTDGVIAGELLEGQKRREVLARIKAFYNVHINGEPTVLGDPIPLQ